MKNKLSDLNNYLFEQLEILNDSDLSEEQIDSAIKKAETVSKIADTIVKTNELQFKALCKCAEYGIINNEQVKILLLPSKNKGE